MSLNLKLPEKTVIKPQITVFGVGGAGGNATNNMIRKMLQGANFVVANTDAQALEYSEAEKRIQLGQTTTQGLGAGAAPEVGRASAEEAAEEIREHLQGSHMVFITAGMGGGTGTGAAPVIARLAREAGILTVGVITKPFHFEGSHRMKLAEAGIAELQANVDTLIIIPNQNLFRIANEKTTFADAFAMADEVLYRGVRSITDLMIMPGLINLDFADVKAVMTEMGKAMMGTGEAEGERRAEEAACAAISNPLLDNTSMKGARGVLINITGGPDMTLFEVDEAANRIREEVDENANIIFGSTFDETLEGKMRVSVVATGIGAAAPEKLAAFHPAITAERQAQPALRPAPSFIPAMPPAPPAAAVAPRFEAIAPSPAFLYPEEEAGQEASEATRAEMFSTPSEEEVSPARVFVSRAPIEPGMHTTSAFAPAQPSPSSPPAGATLPPAYAAGQKGFFSKVAEAAKSTFRKPDGWPEAWDSTVDQELHSITDRANYEGSAPREEELETVGANAESQSLDIPAFLRRKPQ